MGHKVNVYGELCITGYPLSLACQVVKNEVILLMILSLNDKQDDYLPVVCIGK